MLAVRLAAASLAGNAVAVSSGKLLGLTLLANGTDFNVGTMVTNIAGMARSFTLRLTLIVLHAGMVLALLVSLARLLVLASFACSAAEFASAVASAAAVASVFAVVCAAVAVATAAAAVARWRS